MWWWLSFVRDDKNLGCCIVRGDNFSEAVRESHRQGCNPGGQVAGWAYSTPNSFESDRFRFGINRLIHVEEISDKKSVCKISELSEPLQRAVIKSACHSKQFGRG